MLDRTAETAPAVAEAAPGERAARRAQSPLRRARGLRSRRGWRFLVAQSSSSLTRRIVLLNIAGLLALVISILYLSQFRAGLIDARVQSLLVQGEIIAGAIAASATVETDTITIDPDKLLELQTGESYGPIDESLSGARIPDQSGTRRAAAAPPGAADAHAGAHLRPRRRAAARHAQSLRPRRRAALRPDPGRTTGRAGWSAPGSRSRTGSAASTCRSTAISGRPTARAIRRSCRRSPA